MFSEMKVSTRMARVNEGLRAITEENNVEVNHASSMRAAAFQTSNQVLAAEELLALAGEPDAAGASS
jgi:hypothetical protein